MFASAASFPFMVFARNLNSEFTKGTGNTCTFLEISLVELAVSHIYVT